MKFSLPIAVFTTLLSAGTAGGQNTLKMKYADQFLIGTAVNDAQLSRPDGAQAALIAEQFSTITPENALKWEFTEPQLGKFEFERADRFVDFGVRNKMFIVGHTLVWHSQTPDWVFKNAAGAPVDRTILLGRMRDHIRAVVGRYKSRVKGWDVVNEALLEDGSLRNSPWRRIIGDDYIAKAFEYAHEADPDAELYYNDYGIENGTKRAGAIALLRRLKAAGVPITAIGIQEHVNLNWPTSQLLDETLTAFGQAGFKVMVTELDVDVLPARSRSTSADVSRTEAADSALDPYVAGLPEALQQALAQRYAELFAIYLKHRDTVKRVTLWGLTDGDSWLNNWPIKGRTSYPLLFDRGGKPKLAYEAVIGAMKSFSATDERQTQVTATTR